MGVANAKKALKEEGGCVAVRGPELSMGSSDSGTGCNSLTFSGHIQEPPSLSLGGHWKYQLDLRDLYGNKGGEGILMSV